MTPQIDQWFRREVLSRERALNRYLARHLSTRSDIADLRQDVYLRLRERITSEADFPENAGALMHTIARNLLIDRSRQTTVISFDLASEAEIGWHAADLLTPERYVSGIEDVRRLEAGFAKLPERCRQVVRLRKVDGLSQRECAEHLAISERTVAQHIRDGMKALADHMLGGEGRVVHRKKRGFKGLAR